MFLLWNTLSRQLGRSYSTPLAGGPVSWCCASTDAGVHASPDISHCANCASQRHLRALRLFWAGAFQTQDEDCLSQASRSALPPVRKRELNLLCDAAGTPSPHAAAVQPHLRLRSTKRRLLRASLDLFGPTSLVEMKTKLTTIFHRTHASPHWQVRATTAPEKRRCKRLYCALPVPLAPVELPRCRQAARSARPCGPLWTALPPHACRSSRWQARAWCVRCVLYSGSRSRYTPLRARIPEYLRTRGRGISASARPATELLLP